MVYIRSPMSRSKNQGKAKRRVRLTPEFPHGRDALQSRMSYGSTHRILRRNRQLWSRLLARQRRANDRQEIVASSHE